MKDITLEEQKRIDFMTKLIAREPTRIASTYSFIDFEEAFAKIDMNAGYIYNANLFISLVESMLGAAVCQRVSIKNYVTASGVSRWRTEVDGVYISDFEVFCDAFYNVVKELDGKMAI